MPQVLRQGALGAVPHASPPAQPPGTGEAVGRGPGPDGGSQVRSGEPPAPGTTKAGLGGRAARRGRRGAGPRVSSHPIGRRRAPSAIKPAQPSPPRTRPRRQTRSRHPGCAARLAPPPPSFLLRCPPRPRPPSPRRPRDTGPRKFVRASAGRVWRARPAAQRARAPQSAQKGAPRTQAAAAEPLARAPGPPWAPRPAACRSRSASCWWGRCSAGPTPAAAPRCTRNRRFAMQMSVRTATAPAPPPRRGSPPGVQDAPPPCVRGHPACPPPGPERPLLPVLQVDARIAPSSPASTPSLSLSLCPMLPNLKIPPKFRCSSSPRTGSQGPGWVLAGGAARDASAGAGRVGDTACAVEGSPGLGGCRAGGPRRNFHI